MTYNPASHWLAFSAVVDIIKDICCD